MIGRPDDEPMKHVLKPVEQPFSPEIERILAQYPRGSDGMIIKLFGVFANSLRFLTNKDVVNLLDKDRPLSLKEREIVNLRVTELGRLVVDQCLSQTNARGQV